MPARARWASMLACNVIVRETMDGRVEVASIDPVSSLERTGNEALRSAAAEVRRLPSQAVAEVAA